MDWSEIGRKLVGIGARVAGGAIAGPAGAAVGGLVAEALGVEANPAAIDAAIDADPKAADKITQIEPDIPAAVYEHATEALRSVNATMRAELVAHSSLQRLWRPLWGIGANLVWTGTGLALVAAVVVATVSGRSAALADLAGALGDLAWFYTAPLAVVGVVAWGRTAEKTAALAGKSSPGLIEAVAARIAAKGR